MNARDLDATPAPSRGAKPWMWVVLGLVALLTVGSFFYKPAEDAPPKRGGGPQAIAVSGEALKRQTLTERARYPGELRADSAELGALHGGRLIELSGRVGDLVEAGQIIARFDPVDLEAQLAEIRAGKVAADANYKRIQAELAVARRDAERLKNLSRDKLISESELDLAQTKSSALRASLSEASAGIQQAKARESTLEVRKQELEVKAPFRGRIAHRYVDPGTIVNAGAPLVRVVAESPLRVSFEVPESDLAFVQVPLGVELRSVNAPLAYKAQVRGVAAQVSGASRKAQAEAELLEAPEHWRAGMYVDVWAPVKTTAGELTAPSSALLTRLLPSGAVSSGVFVHEAGKAKWVEVQVLAREGENVALRPLETELTEASVVLTQGHTDLVDGSAVRLTVATLEEPPHVP